jgi:hypothetical protein
MVTFLLVSCKELFSPSAVAAAVFSNSGVEGFKMANGFVVAARLIADCARNAPVCALGLTLKDETEMVPKRPKNLKPMPQFRAPARDIS